MRRNLCCDWKAVVVMAAILLLPWPAAADPVTVRVKDIAHLKGVTENQLVGYGLVMGLSGTGDSYTSLQTNQAAANLLKNLGLQVSSNGLRTRNVAAVIVTAKLPAFATNGGTVDVTVSSMGDARSLDGGVLALTTLQGADHQVYATAQGAVAVSAQNRNSAPASYTRGTLTGRIPGGGLVVQDVTTPLTDGGALVWVLNKADFATANALAAALNGRYGSGIAVAEDQSSVRMQIPARYSGNPVALIAEAEVLTLSADQPALVVINQRTGTLVLGGRVTLASAAVSHGRYNLCVGYPEGKAGAKNPAVTMVPEGATLQQVVDALNALGASPQDLIEIVQALQAAGSLKAQVEIQ